MEASNHVLRLTGKAELPQSVDIGSNYHVSLEGSITAVTESDNENNTVTRLYTFKPIKVELLDPLGTTIKAKDTRSNSQLMRALLYKIWVNAASTEVFDEFYSRILLGMMRDINELVARYE